MRIKELQLRDFRGFKKLDFKFPDSNLLVLVGINGSGKSSILDCIAMCLSRFVRILVGNKPNEVEFPITENDINIAADGTNSRIIFERMSVNATTKEKSIIESVIGISEGSISERHRFEYKVPDPDAIYDDIETKIKEEPESSLPVLSYYQNQKIFLESPTKSRPEDYLFKQYVAYEGAFKKGIHDFNDFISWFKDEEDWENQQKIKEGLDFVNKNLEVIRRAIKTVLNEIPSTDFSHLHVVRSKRDKTFRFDNRYESSLVIEKNGKSLKLEQLSDGEKMLLLVVSDLARRLSIANPGLDDALQGEGIVLIDEIDLHLHPQWQRQVIPALRRTFPNCQFIVTTHSPQVLSNVEKENIVILEDFKIVEKTPYTYGRDSNSILYELMNVEERPAAVKNKLDKLYRLIDDEKLDEARKELKELEAVLGENDKDIVRANMYIDF